jgi:hypothetical protein
MSDISASEDIIQQPKPINFNIHLNCIIITSDNPAIPSKALAVPSFGGPLSAEQTEEIIRREREKMAEAAKSATETEESGELNSCVKVENG